MRRVLLLAALLAGLALVLWMRARAPLRDVDSAPTPPAVPEVERGAESLPAPAHGPATESRACEAVEASSAAPATRSQVASEPGQSTAAPLFVLHIVDENDRPVAGVPVRFVDLATAYADSPWVDPRNLLDNELDTLCARLGPSCVSDGEGIVRVPKRESGGIAIAEQNGRWGWALPRYFDDYTLDPDEDESISLVLHEDRALLVRVVDGAGMPAAGALVALRSRAEDQVVDVFRTRTDANGQARLRHLQVLLEDGPVPEGWSVSLALLALEPVEYALQPGPLPSEPVKLVAPATGTLEIRLEDAEGRPLELNAWVELELAPRSARSADEEWERNLHGRHDDQRLSVFARSRRARVEHIWVALTLDVRVRPVEGFRPFEVRRFGP